MNAAGYLSIGSNGRYEFGGGTLQINGGLSSQGVFAGGGGTGALSVVNSILDFSSGTWQNCGAISATVSGASLVIVPPAIQSGQPLRQLFQHCNRPYRRDHAHGCRRAASNGHRHDQRSGQLPGTDHRLPGVHQHERRDYAIRHGCRQPGDPHNQQHASGMSGGSLHANEPYIGSGGNGQFSQSAGVFSVGTVTGSNSLAGGSLYLGQNAGNNGTYTLSGSGMLSAYWEYVGNSGTGSFTQSGGTNSVAYASWTSTLYLGYSASSSGTYSLSGSGLLSDYAADIGFAGVGVFNQTGGTHAVARYIVLGASGGTGTYNLSGSGVLLASAGEVVDNGTFTQSGGVNSISGTGSESTMGGLNLAGTYILSGNGLLSVTGTECVGYYGGGTFTHSSGTNVTGSLYVGYGAGGNGSYNLSGNSQLSASNEYVGFEYLEGDNSASNFSGAFTQSGGTNSVAAGLYIGEYLSTQQGTYNLLGGMLVLSELYPGSAAGSAFFNFSGGTLKANNSFSSSISMTLGTGSGQPRHKRLHRHTCRFTFRSRQPDESWQRHADLDWQQHLHRPDHRQARRTPRQRLARQPRHGQQRRPGRHGHPQHGHRKPQRRDCTGQPAGNPHAQRQPDPVVGGDARLRPRHAFHQRHDRLRASLVASPLGFSNFSFENTSNFGPGVYDLIQSNTSLPGNLLGGSTSGSVDGYPANLSVSGNDVVLTVVPEPSALRCWALPSALPAMSGDGGKRDPCSLTAFNQPDVPYHVGLCGEGRYCTLVRGQGAKCGSPLHWEGTLGLKSPTASRSGRTSAGGILEAACTVGLPDTGLRTRACGWITSQPRRRWGAARTSRSTATSGRPRSHRTTHPSRRGLRSRKVIRGNSSVLLLADDPGSLPHRGRGSFCKGGGSNSLASTQVFVRGVQG